MASLEGPSLACDGGAGRGAAPIVKEPQPGFTGLDRTACGNWIFHHAMDWKDDKANCNLEVAMFIIARPSPRAPATDSSGSAALDLLIRIEGVLQRLSQRHELAKLTDADLKDLGWSRADALQELEKPFWR